MTQKHKPHQTGGDVPPPPKPDVEPLPPTPKKKLFTWEFFTRTGAVIAFIVTILGIGGGVLHYLDARIDGKLNDRDFLYKLGKASRPMLVFKGDETYVSNEGAAEFIKELKVTSRASMGGITNLPGHIHVEFQQFFQLAPLLTPVTFANCNIESTRGKGNSWEFDISYSALSDAPDIGNQFQFRLDILP